MDLNDTPEQATYRAEVRAVLEQHKDAAPAVRGRDVKRDDAFITAMRGWQRTLAEAGLVGVTWPKEFGGGGLGPLNQVIINQELARLGLPGILDVIGVGMLGPTIIAHGTEEQKSRYLAPMLHADEVWCQLFSEPAAGSDLAGMQTRAKQRDDGSWVVNGQKVWTTNAQFASFGILVVRTDADVPKHKGLTMFIVPMDAEGVTIRGLRQITGEAEFNEVFFDDVVIPDDLRVGAVGGGWGCALTTLMFERLTIGLGSDQFGYRADRFAAMIAEDEVASSDHGIRKELGLISSDLLALRFLSFRTLTTLAKGGIPGPEAGLGKVTTVRAASAAGDLLADAVGPDALDMGELGHLIAFIPGLKSAGGTEEILYNTIGERVLGLPPEPRLDKGVPFNELRAIEKEAVA